MPIQYLHQPDEVLRKIAENLYSDHTSLRSFFQVCKEWAGPGREVLWQETQSRMLEAVPDEHRQDFANFVRVLDLEPSNRWDQKMRNLSLPRLKLLNISCNKKNMQQRLGRNVYRCIPSTVRTLSVSMHQPNSMDVLGDLLNRLVNLEKVMITRYLENEVIINTLPNLLCRDKLVSMYLCRDVCETLLEHLSNSPHIHISIEEVQKIATIDGQLALSLRKPAPVVLEAISTFKKLDRLDLNLRGKLHGFQFQPPSTTLDSLAFSSIAKLSNLTTLVLDISQNGSSTNFPVRTMDWQQLFDGLPKLERFLIGTLGVLNATILRQLGLRCRQLKGLIVYDSIDISQLQLNDDKVLFPQLLSFTILGLGLTGVRPEDAWSELGRLLKLGLPKVKKVVMSWNAPLALLLAEFGELEYETGGLTW
ncbi:hypothetical protein K470DRAFT_256989 [Piedraia hortae CBS 480.64]|uniref:F-box domain-containing protein n=1 Tax=Piedraia hortae CBS 480.64 TaxID=1314780 RepID=A0A6A7C2Y9_9PEZI|nr:hypothetical protein K470DRAFT_256989 [Piedraia hortae CBS 480.64]